MVFASGEGNYGILRAGITSELVRVSQPHCGWLTPGIQHPTPGSQGSSKGFAQMSPALLGRAPLKGHKSQESATPSLHHSFLTNQVSSGCLHCTSHGTPRRSNARQGHITSWSLAAASQPSFLGHAVSSPAYLSSQALQCQPGHPLGSPASEKTVVSNCYTHTVPPHCTGTNKPARGWW